MLTLKFKVVMMDKLDYKLEEKVHRVISSVSVNMSRLSQFED